MKKTIEERFNKFHEENPHIYAELMKLCYQAHNNGRSKIGIGMLFEVLRWNGHILTNAKDFKMCNDYRSRYARKIMAENTDLKNIFNIRELTTN